MPGYPGRGILTERGTPHCPFREVVCDTEMVLCHEAAALGSSLLLSVTLTCALKEFKLDLGGVIALIFHRWPIWGEMDIRSRLPWSRSHNSE